MGPDENYDYDYYGPPQGARGYVPHEDDQEPTSDSVSTNPETKGDLALSLKKEAGEARIADTFVLLDEAVKLDGKGEERQYPDLLPALTLLKHYQEAQGINWKEPRDPLPSFESMSFEGKALWLFMANATDGNDGYGVSPREFINHFEPFLQKCLGVNSPEDLDDDIRDALEDQLGIGPHLLSHPDTFRSQEEKLDIRFSSQED